MTSAAPHPPNRARVIAAYLALYLIWGSTYLFIKWVVVDVPPFLAGAIRHGAAGLILYAWARARGAPRPTRREWAIAVVIGIMLLGIGNGMVNWAVQRVPSGLTSLIVSSVPIWMVLVDWLRPHGTRPTRRIVAGLTLGMMGIAGLVWSAGGIDAGAASSAMVRVACVVLLLGSLSWAAGSIFARHVRRNAHGRLATSMEMMSAAPMLLIVAVLTGETQRFDVAAVSAAAWWSLGYLIAFGSLVAFTAYTWLLRVSTPAKVATYAYVNPLVAVALGWAFAGERLSTATFGAAGLILGAVVLITLPSRTV
jgi:drug/metabolite transporter (DMT)-like permease